MNIAPGGGEGAIVLHRIAIEIPQILHLTEPLTGSLLRRAGNAGAQHDGAALLVGQFGQRLFNKCQRTPHFGATGEGLACLGKRLELLAHLPRVALEVGQQLGEVGQPAATEVADHLLDLLLALELRHLVEVVPHQCLYLADTGLTVAQLALGQGELGALGKDEGELFCHVAQRLGRAGQHDLLALKLSSLQGHLTGGILGATGFRLSGGEIGIALDSGHGGSRNEWIDEDGIIKIALGRLCQNRP